MRHFAVFRFGGLQSGPFQAGRNQFSPSPLDVNKVVQVLGSGLEYARAALAVRGCFLFLSSVFANSVCPHFAGADLARQYF
jgi:hypothetical protein